MLKKIFGKKSEVEDGIKPVKANLGEENKFYYNKELKSWVVRGEEHLLEEKKNLPPPPKRPTTSEYGSRVDSTASLSSLSYNGGNTRKNLYTATPGLNIKKVPEASGGIIPVVGLHQSSSTQALNSKLFNSKIEDENKIFKTEPFSQYSFNAHDNDHNNSSNCAIDSVNTNTSSQNSVNTMFSDQLSDKTSINTEFNTNKTVIKRIELPPSIPTLPGSLMLDKAVCNKFLGRSQSKDSQSCALNTNENNNVNYNFGENNIHDSGYSNKNDKLNSESDNLELNYTQNDMRQRQRIRPSSNRSNNSADLTEIESLKRNDSLNKIFNYISIFGYVYDNKSCKIIDDNSNSDQVKKLDEICNEIKEIRFKKLYDMIDIVHNIILDSNKDYESLIEMILNIGTITNKSFQEISSTINTAMSNSDEIEKELLRTKKSYSELLDKYKGLYRQYESDMINLRSELENEKNINSANNKEYNDKITNLRKEYVDNETSKNALLNQYYSYIESMQEKYDELNKEHTELDDNLKKSKEEILLLNNELLSVRNDIKTKEDENKVKIYNLEELNNKLSTELELKSSMNNELKMEYENKTNEIKMEYEQQIKLIEKYNLEQDNEIINLKSSLEKINFDTSELVKQYEDKLSEIRTRLDEFENMNCQLNRELDLVNEEKNSINKKMESEISKLKFDNDNIMSELSNKVSENNCMNTEICKLKSENEAYIKEIDDLNEKYNNLNAEYNDNLIKHKEYENNVVDIKNEYELKISQLNEHINMLGNTAAKVDDEWRTRQSHLESNYEQLYSQYISISNKNEEYDLLSDKYNNLELEYNTLCNNNKEYISELESRLKDHENCRDCISELESRLKDHENCRDYISELESRMKDHENCRNYISELESRLKDHENCRDYISELELGIEKMKQDQNNSVPESETNRLKMENERLRDTNEAVYIKLEAFLRDIDMLNNQLEWIRRYSPEIYNSMLENTDSYMSNINNNDVSDISL
ncbi:coiled coil protein [Cryptosporidium ryanae]|uniref:coiled coil protein n=1 Tax=Cryptosporidium ryanae TaxID=515981 RepID=UPI003519F757|nr:coiled coil protein [Cryptosporidium ryanae]